MTVIYWSNIKLDHIVMFMIYSISFLNSNKRTYNKAVGKGLYRWFIFVHTRGSKIEAHDGHFGSIKKGLWVTLSTVKVFQMNTN